MDFREVGAIGICIDEYNDGEMKGRVFSSAHEDPENFTSVISLVKQINAIFDEGDYPQATTRCRGFGRSTSASKETRDAKSQTRPVSDPRKVATVRNNIRGKKATFRVKVMFRQNASWQGSLFWVEKNCEENFRSVLELMMLIDSSFASERAVSSGSDDMKLTANM